MHIAAVRGDYKIIKLLMLFGATPFVFTYSTGFSPLDYARESGKDDSFNVLKPLFDDNIKNKQSSNNFYDTNSQVFIN